MDAEGSGAQTKSQKTRQRRRAARAAMALKCDKRISRPIEKSVAIKDKASKRQQKKAIRRYHQLIKTGAGPAAVADMDKATSAQSMAEKTKVLIGQNVSQQRIQLREGIAKVTKQLLN